MFLPPRIIDLASRFSRLKSASRPQERAAIYRLRYDVFVRELGRVYSGANHEKGWLFEPEDEADNTTHYYLGSERQALAALRVRYWPAGQLPRDQRERYHTALLPLDGCDCVTIGLMAVHPSKRGRLASAQLTVAAIEHFAARHPVHVALSDCVPGLLHLWRRLGFRPYGAPLIQKADVSTIPIAGVATDFSHMDEVDSLWRFALRRAQRRGHLPALPKGRLEELRRCFERTVSLRWSPRALSRSCRAQTSQPESA